MVLPLPRKNSRVLSLVSATLEIEHACSSSLTALSVLDSEFCRDKRQGCETFMGKWIDMRHLLLPDSSMVTKLETVRRAITSSVSHTVFEYFWSIINTTVGGVRTGGHIY